MCLPAARSALPPLTLPVSSVPLQLHLCPGVCSPRRAGERDAFEFKTVYVKKDGGNANTPPYIPCYLRAKRRRDKLLLASE